MGCTNCSCATEPKKNRELRECVLSGVAPPHATRDHGELSQRTVGFRVDVPDDFRARENRERVVATHTFGRRGVNFPRVVEAPEARGDDSVVN